MPPPPGLVEAVVVGGGVAGGLVGGGAVADGVDGGRLDVEGDGVGFTGAAGGDVDGIDGVAAAFAFAGPAVVVEDLAGSVAMGLPVVGCEVTDVLARVDVVLGVLAPEDVQAARYRPAAATKPRDRIAPFIQILSFEFSSC